MHLDTSLKKNDVLIKVHFYACVGITSYVIDFLKYRKHLPKKQKPIRTAETAFTVQG